MVLDNHQRLSGWIDMLIELDDGFVVIDHKSYSGDEVEEYAKQYAPQLAVYHDAVVQATGEPVAYERETCGSIMELDSIYNN